MTQIPGLFTNFASGNVAVVTTAETVVGTSKAVSSPYPGAVFTILFVLDFLTGAATTGLIYRIRRSTLTGTAVLTTPTIVAAAAAQDERQTVACTDQPTGEIASDVYVLTVAQIAATGNGQASNVFSAVGIAG